MHPHGPGNRGHSRVAARTRLQLMRTDAIGSKLSFKFCSARTHRDSEPPSLPPRSNDGICPRPCENHFAVHLGARLIQAIPLTRIKDWWIPALGNRVSTVRYPIPQRTFKYVATVQSVTDETCQHRKCAPSHHPPPRSCALPFHVLGKREVGERGESRANHEGVTACFA
jgi:hypothetical protein